MNNANTFCCSLSSWWSVPFRFPHLFKSFPSVLHTNMRTFLGCERTDFKMSCLNEYPAEQLSCAYSFIVCTASCVELLSIPLLLLLAAMIVVVAHPLMSNFANLCFASALCCVVLDVCPVSRLHSTCLSAPPCCDIIIGLLLP